MISPFIHLLLSSKLPQGLTLYNFLMDIKATGGKISAVIGKDSDKNFDGTYKKRVTVTENGNK